MIRHLTPFALLIAGPATAQTQADMNRQAGADFVRADAAMTTAYRAAMAEMGRMDALHAPDARTGPSYRNALLAAQRAWLRFRDAECVVQGYQLRGGTAQGMAIAGCKTDLTRQRTRQLQELVR